MTESEIRIIKRHIFINVVFAIVITAIELLWYCSDLLTPYIVRPGLMWVGFIAIAMNVTAVMVSYNKIKELKNLNG